LALTLEQAGTQVPDVAAAVERARAGDAHAFRELYVQHSGRVYALCLRMLADPDAAEEATQDAFVRAWERLGGFEGRAAFSTGLHRLTVSLVLDRRRREKVRPLDRRIPDGDETVERTGGRPLSPEAAIDLERAIASLPPACRAAFLLHDVEGFGHHEVGTMLGVSEGTSKSQVHKARMRIRAYLANGLRKKVEG
jgi:RNA polymerase sigma-70 factor (ECF subfamily)